MEDDEFDYSSDQVEQANEGMEDIEDDDDETGEIDDEDAADEEDLEEDLDLREVLLQGGLEHEHALNGSDPFLVHVRRTWRDSCPTHILIKSHHYRLVVFKKVTWRGRQGEPIYRSEFKVGGQWLFLYRCYKGTGMRHPWIIGRTARGCARIIEQAHHNGHDNYEEECWASDRAYLHCHLCPSDVKEWRAYTRNGWIEPGTGHFSITERPCPSWVEITSGDDTHKYHRLTTHGHKLVYQGSKEDGLIKQVSVAHRRRGYNRWIGDFGDEKLLANSWVAWCPNEFTNWQVGTVESNKFVHRAQAYAEPHCRPALNLHQTCDGNEVNSEWDACHWPDALGIYVKTSQQKAFRPVYQLSAGRHSLPLHYKHQPNGPYTGYSYVYPDNYNYHLYFAGDGSTGSWRVASDWTPVARRRRQWMPIMKTFSATPDFSDWCPGHAEFGAMIFYHDGWGYWESMSHDHPAYYVGKVSLNFEYPVDPAAPEPGSPEAKYLDRVAGRPEDYAHPGSETCKTYSGGQKCRHDLECNCGYICVLQECKVPPSDPW